MHFSVLFVINSILAPQLFRTEGFRIQRTIHLQMSFSNMPLSTIPLLTKNKIFSYSNIALLFELLLVHGE